MKRILMSISTFSLVLILTFSSFQLESASAISIENHSNLIEPLGYEDEVRACSGNFYSSDGESYVTIQTNTNSVDRSLQWGFFINESAFYKYNPEVTVLLESTTVNGKNVPDRPYSPHTESPDYNFHGSMKVYKIAGTSTNINLKSKDIVYFAFKAYRGSENTSVKFECSVK